MEGRQYRYTSYGIDVITNRELPGFKQSVVNNPADLILHQHTQKIDFTRFSHIIELNNTSVISSNFSPITKSITNSIADPNSSNSCFRISYSNGITFVVMGDGSELWAQWPETASRDVIFPYLSGAIMGFVLRLQGKLCLHASVVEVDGHAIAMIAPSGGGKSTLAAALSLEGCSLLSDDILVLDSTENDIHAQSGSPVIRLCADSAEALIVEQDLKANMVVERNKHLLRMPEPECSFTKKPVPLAAIYTRVTDCSPEKPFIKPVLQSEALITLLANTYPNPYYQLPSLIRQKELKQLAQLIRKVPIRGIDFQRKLENLPDLCTALLTDTKRLIKRKKQNPDLMANDD